MRFKTINFLLFFLFYFLIIRTVFSSEIKNIALINNTLITNEDIRKEKIILGYLLNITQEIPEQVALDNLIEENIKKIEIKKNTNLFLSQEETHKYLNLILKKNNKSLEDFRKKLNDKVYEDYLKEKIKVEILWNKYIVLKFASELDINMDEIIAKSQTSNDGKTTIKDLVTVEKNKKLNVLSDTFFNEVKNKMTIKIL